MIIRSEIANRPVKPRFFATADELRTHFGKVHDTASELWIGFYKKASKRPSVTYHEALDEALSVGWIDGVRKALDSWTFFSAQPPGYRRVATFFVVSAKRLKVLIDDCAGGRRLPMFAPMKTK
jgi:uncharacterized protein YdeI (YjbR/CyaY-like superfamily)